MDSLYDLWKSFSYAWWKGKTCDPHEKLILLRAITARLWCRLSHCLCVAPLSFSVLIYGTLAYALTAFSGPTTVLSSWKRCFLVRFRGSRVFWAFLSGVGNCFRWNNGVAFLFFDSIGTLLRSSENVCTVPWIIPACCLMKSSFQTAQSFHCGQNGWILKCLANPFFCQPGSTLLSTTFGSLFHEEVLLFLLPYDHISTFFIVRNDFED